MFGPKSANVAPRIKVIRLGRVMAGPILRGLLSKVVAKLWGMDTVWIYKRLQAMPDQLIGGGKCFSKYRTVHKNRPTKCFVIHRYNYIVLL